MSKISQDILQIPRRELGVRAIRGHFLRQFHVCACILAIQIVTVCENAMWIFSALFQQVSAALWLAFVAIMNMLFQCFCLLPVPLTRLAGTRNDYSVSVNASVLAVWKSQTLA